MASKESVKQPIILPTYSDQVGGQMDGGDQDLQKLFNIGHIAMANFDGCSD